MAQSIPAMPGGGAGFGARRLGWPLGAAAAGWGADPPARVSGRAWQAGHGGVLPAPVGSSTVQALMGRHEPPPALARISFSFWFVRVSVSPCLSVLRSSAWLLCLVCAVLMTQCCFIHVLV